MAIMKEQQREQLNAAIHSYLLQYFPRVADEFAAAMGGTMAEGNVSKSILENKWTAALRMQRKVLELEKEIEGLKAQLALYTVASRYKGQQGGIPSEPFVAKLVGHRRSITKVLFHPVFQFLVTASEDGTIKVWDYERDGQLETTMRDHTDSVNDIALNSSGKWLASASTDLFVKLWDMTNYQCIRTLVGHDAVVSSVVFTHYTESLLSASKDQTIKLWDVQSGFCLRTFHGHSEWVRCVSCPFMDNFKVFASCGNDKRICIWSTEDDSVFQQLLGHNHVVECLLFAPLSMLMLFKKHQMTPLPLPTHLKVHKDKGGLDLEEPWFDHCGLILISASRDRTIKLWDVARGTCIHTFVGHDSWVRALTVHSAGYYLISCSDDRSIRVWETLTGNVVRVLSAAHPRFVTSIALNANDTLFASGSMDNTIHLWECHATDADAHA